MKKTFKIIITTFLIATLAVFGLFGCNNEQTSETPKYVISIEKAVDSDKNYIVTYSDGTTSVIEMTKGDAGQNGVDGIDGKDGENFDLDSLYAKYLEIYPNANYEDFLKNVVNVNTEGNVTAINKALKSSAKIYTEFTESYMVSPFQTTTDTTVYLGSAVVYQVDATYTYFITNYHVVYNSSAIETDKIAKRMVCYLYGSESEPVSSATKGADGYTAYNYGAYGIDCEYVGGSITADIAVIKAKNVDVRAINDDIETLDFATDYHVGETAIAIGNPEGEGISVTEGIVSVDNEYITLALDGTSRKYRSVRIDTSIYNGSSGGGLFNTDGKLIGITNAGDGEDQNVNYAIPVEIVKSAVENIMYYASIGEKNAKKITLGVTVSSLNSKYVYNGTLGYGEIIEDVVVASVVDNSICSAMGLAVDDKITAFTIDGTKHYVNRSFNIGDLLLQIRSGNVISMDYVRGGSSFTSSSYAVIDSDLNIVA